MRSMKKLFLMVWILLISMILVFSFPATDASKYDQASRELDHFFKAKKYVFQREWQEANAQLKNYLHNYPSGQMRDEALYWLALSMNKGAVKISKIKEVIAVKEQAIGRLNELIKSHPTSLWQDDARSLRIEIAGELVVLGKNGFKKYINDVIKKENRTESELKLMALNSLIRLDPAAAIPTLASLLEKERDPLVRKNVAFLLGKNYSSQVVDILEKALKKDPDTRVKEELVYWLDRIKIRLLPVQLNYFVLSAGITDPARAKHIRDNSLTLLPVNLGDRFSKRAFQQSINKLLKQKLTWSLNQASSIDVNAESLHSSHNTRYVNIRVLNGTIKKQANSIRGKVLFQPLKNKNTHSGEFIVNDRKDQIFLFRHKDHLDMLILHFQHKGLPRESASTTEGNRLMQLVKQIRRISSKLGLSKYPVYYTQYNNVLGCTVNTTLQSTGNVRKQGKMDFSEAEAEIPSSSGRWKLKGHLLLLKTERLFVARKGILVNPSGEVAASGLEVRVPIDNPGKFTVRGDFSTEPPAKVNEIVYRGVFNISDNLVIYSSRETYRLEEFSADVILFNQAKAVIKTKQGKWTVVGKLAFHKKSRQIVARAATLVAPGKDTKIKGRTIIIPTDHPQKYQIKKQ